MTTISSKLADKTLEITIEGRFDFSASQAFLAAYEEKTPKPERYVIHLARADYLDSSALGMLLTLREYAGAEEADITLSQVQPDVKKLLVVTKLDELFTID